MTAARRLVVDFVSTVAHRSGWTALQRRRRLRRGDRRLFILEYHDLCESRRDEREGIVSGPRLDVHLQWLKERFERVTVEQGARWLLGDAPAAGDNDLLAITFDDGYVSNHAIAGPVLRRHQSPATIYLTTGFVDGAPLWFDVARHRFDALRGRESEIPAATAELLRRVLGRWPYGDGETSALKHAPCEDRLEVLASLETLDLELPPFRQAMTWQQIQELQAQGIEMGAHTVTHPILSRQSADQQAQELRASRQRIAEMTGVEPTTFAFPNGAAEDFDGNTLESLRRQGYLASCTTIRGSNRPGDEPMTLRRLGIGADSISVLASRLAGLFDQGLRRFLPGSVGQAPRHG